MRLIRHVGVPLDNAEEAGDSLHGTLAVDAVKFAYVDDQHRTVMFVDCGPHGHGLVKGEIPVRECVTGPAWDRTNPPKELVSMECAAWSQTQHKATLVMFKDSPCLLFGHLHPKDPTLAVLYFTLEHDIAGVPKSPVYIDL